MSGRWWFGLCAAGCGLALAYRGHWAASVVAEATALVPLVLWVRGEMTAQRAMMREAPQPEPVPAARAVPEPRPPWDTAECPVIPPVPRDGPGAEGTGEGGGCGKPLPARSGP